MAAFGAIIGIAAAQTMSTVLGVIIGQTVAPVLTPIANKAQQWANRILPTTLVPVVNAVDMRYRGITTQKQYFNELDSQGFTDERIENLYKVSENMLGIAELITAYRRGTMTKELLVIKAAHIHWNEFDVERLLHISKTIPSAQDIIAFAVREVYSPAIAEAFGQTEGGADVYDKASDDLRAIGMDKDVFLQYWAAHWMLPSIGQGFEMLHRQVIPAASSDPSELTLEKLLVALDIMPAWRDKLTAISYSPFTRVDVRRMNKLGILADDDLLKAYTDLGYDTEKAQAMKDFTIAYNYDPPEVEQTTTDIIKVKERDLTKADLITGYKEGLLSEGDISTSLTALGYSGTEAAYYLSRAKYEAERSETEDSLRIYHDGFIKGVFSLVDTMSFIGGLDLPSDKTDKLLTAWQLEKSIKSNRPSKAEVLSFARKGIITADQAQVELSALGYNDDYISWYMATVK